MPKGFADKLKSCVGHRSKFGRRCLGGVTKEMDSNGLWHRYPNGLWHRYLAPLSGTVIWHRYLAPLSAEQIPVDKSPQLNLVTTRRYTSLNHVMGDNKSTKPLYFGLGSIHDRFSQIWGTILVVMATSFACAKSPQEQLVTLDTALKTEAPWPITSPTFSECHLRGPVDCPERIEGRRFRVCAEEGPCPCPEEPTAECFPSINEAIGYPHFLPGDNIVLAPGEHRLTQVEAYPKTHYWNNLNGSRCDPITIQGTRVEGVNASVVTASITGFTWIEADDLVDLYPGLSLYRSSLALSDIFDLQAWLTTTGTSTDKNLVYAFRGSYQESHRRAQQSIQLVSYYYRENFFAEQTELDLAIEGDTKAYSSPYYIGPGLFFDASACLALLEGDLEANEFACHLYLRLDSTPSRDELGYAPISIPSADIKIFANNVSRLMFQESSFLTIKDLDFEAMDRIGVFNSSSDIKFDQIRLRTTKFEIAGQDTSSRPQRIKVHGLISDYGIPEYIFWSDLKYPPASALEWPRHDGAQGPAFRFHESQIRFAPYGLHDRIGPDCIEMKDSHVSNGWFGVSSAGHRIRLLHNHFDGQRDDAIFFSSTNATQNEYAYNLITNSFSGFTQHPVGLAPEEYQGSVYIHHNVVDLARFETHPDEVKIGKVRASSLGAPAEFMTNYALYSSHSNETPVESPISVYNNTFIAKNKDHPVIGHIFNTSAEKPSIFLNNIVIQNENTQPVFRDGIAWSRDNTLRGVPLIADGNIYTRGRPEEYVDASTDCLETEESPHEVSAFAIDFSFSDELDFVAGLYAVSDDLGGYITPEKKHTAFQSWDDYLCDRPTSGPFYFSERDDPEFERHALNIYERSATWFTPLCPIDRPSCYAGYESNSSVEDPGLDSEYRSELGARVLIPAQYPMHNSSFLGACGNRHPCRVGPK